MKVLKFAANWCQPCRMLTKIIEGTNVSISIEEIDIDENEVMAQSFKIRGVPTCILVNDDGTEIARKVGLMTEAEFKQFVGE